ncbi:MAG: restriction endonuclease subunit S [Burkholderiaceae bacterium]|nr:restriction endonuclease subunit S [Burkholderiaceae bacterium]
MTAGWREEPLGAVCQFINRGISPAYLERGGLAVLNQKCVRDHAVNLDLGRRHDATVKKVTPDRLLRAGDVLVNSTGTGTLGRVAQLRVEPPEPTTVDSHVTIVRPAPGLFFPDFFGYALVSIEEQIQDGGEGCGGQTELSRSKLAEGYRVRFPVDLKEQRRLVAILDEAFEGIATAKANAEKNLQNAREMFESRLRSLVNEEAAGSDRKTLREIAIDFGRGKSKHRPRNDPKLYGGPYPFIQTGDVRGSDHLITDYVQTYSEAGLAQSKLWPKGTLCITIAANIAETGVLGFDACFPDSVIGVVVDERQTSSKYLEYMLQTVKAELKAKGKGSAQDNINLATFENERFPFPDINTQARIVESLDALAAEIQRLEDIYANKLAALDDLKRSLLHQAFSGGLPPQHDRQLHGHGLQMCTQ